MVDNTPKLQRVNSVSLYFDGMRKSAPGIRLGAETSWEVKLLCELGRPPALRECVLAGLRATSGVEHYAKSSALLVVGRPPQTRQPSCWLGIGEEVAEDC